MSAHECFATDLAAYRISLVQTGFDRFTVTYGLQETRDLSYAQAAAELGASIMHALACEGRLDNRRADEAREAGDTTPVYEQ